MSNEEKDIGEFQRFKEIFFKSSDDEIREFIQKVKDFINEKAAEFIEEYEDFLDEEIEIDTTESSDWEPHGRIASKEEVSEIIYEEYGSEDNYVNQQLEEFSESHSFIDLFSSEPIIQQYTEEELEEKDLDGWIWEYFF